MTLNVTIDDELVEEAKAIGHHNTDAEAVTAALREYVKRRRQQRVVELFGSIEYDPDYDHKTQRLRS